MRRICIGLMAGVLGCALALPFPGAAVAAPKEKILHGFGSGSDGQYPKAGLIDVKGTLYGTTYAGGANGEGTIFAVNAKTGDETVLYSFCGFSNCLDGANPAAGLIEVNGKLYGTTSGGGNGLGTVFAFNPKNGVITLLYSFTGGASDGEYPAAGLLDVNGTLYGTTEYGGGADDGTVFSINPKTGAETVLVEFAGSDGQNPVASLIDANGMLYGTTEYGGANSEGTVFLYDPSTQALEVAYSFCSQQNCLDGGNPAAALIEVKGVLYGTASHGGNANVGTVFALDPSAGLTVLYSFAGGTDGAYPEASLIDVKNTLYGTTTEGGAYCTSIGGCGTAFAVDPRTSTESVLHSFGNGTDGANPEAGLIDAKHRLYGTTYSGGPYGYGTVFELANP